MGRIFIITIIVFIVFLLGCQKNSANELEQTFPLSFQITLNNPADISRTDEPVFLEIADIKAKYPDFNPQAFVVLSGEKELASQLVDQNSDGESEQILFMLDMNAKSEVKATIRYAKSGSQKREYTKRTQAELSHKFGGKFVDREYQGGEFKNVQFMKVPPEHKDHSWYIRYEGPGWESDKVGYRFYLDWRNATDIYGKKVHDMVLQNVGLDGFDSYHEMSDWGMDILKVGESLGIGSIAMWENNKANRVAVTDSITCKITDNGSIFSQITTNYYGWKMRDSKYDLTSNLSITAGSRITKHSLTITNNPDNLCTGIVKHEDIKILKGPGTDNWNYFATYGKQSLAGDNLGMAVLYKNADFIEQSEDIESYVTVLNANDGKLEYYFLAAWEKELNGIKNIDEFSQYLNLEILKLNDPIVINF